jgi:hypothetical protein
MKSVHLNGVKDCNMRPADGKINSTFFYLPDNYCVSALCEMADLKQVVSFLPYPLQHVTVDV